MSRDDKKIRAAGWAGVAMIPLTLAPFLLTVHLGDLSRWFPSASDTNAQIVQWFSENKARTITQCFVSNVGFILLTLFAVGVIELLKDASRAQMLVRTIVPAMVGTATLWLSTNGFWMIGSLAGSAGHPAPDTVVRLSFDAAVQIYYFALPFASWMIFSISLGILDTRALPRWTGWAGLLVATVNVFGIFIGLAGTGPFAPFAPLSTVPFLMFYAWTVTISVIMLRTARFPELRVTP